jgi:hypothetical protein
MNDLDRELSLDELAAVVGGSDFSFQLQQAVNAQTQSHQQTANASRGYHHTASAILGNFRG